MDDRLICLLCPVGCELEVRREGEALNVRGSQCDKGVEFAQDEVLHPKRNLATSIPARTEAGAAGTLPARTEAGAAGTFPARGTAARMISVRLSDCVPRDAIFPILAEIAKLRPPLPVRRGQVLIADVLGTGVNVIATRTVE
jgi:CxxC motif-containing protein